MDKAKLIKKSNTLVSRITVITLTFMMLVTGMQFSAMSPLVAHAEDTVEVSSWAGLKAAINGSASEITITADIFADGDTITIPNGKSITINGNKTIYRGRKDGMDSLFKVEDGGSLTIGGTVKLSGKEYTCTPQTVSQVEGVVTKKPPAGVPTSLDDPTYKRTTPASSSKVSAPFEIQGPDQGSVTGYKFVPGGPTTLTVDSNGNLKSESHSNMYVVFNTAKGLDLKSSADGTVVLKDMSGNTATTIEKDDSYALYTSYGGGAYIYYNSVNGLYYYDNLVGPTADKNVKLTGLAGTGSTYWEIPDENDNPVEYTDEDAAQAALDAYIDRLSTWVVSRKGDSSISEECETEAAANSKKTQWPYAYWIIGDDENTKYESEQAAEAAAGEGDCSPKQGCDDFVPITKTQFNGTSMEAPKGFFIQVEQGGKAKLAGGTLSDFVTSREKDKTPKYVAPVAVVGGTFDIEGGNITNNIVGYIVDDEKAYENANAIKMYVKGAAPNSPRTGGERRNSPAGIDGVNSGGEAGSGITATAGAVIYVGGATGTVSGGTISMNRGDTGGIMASGDETKVTLAGGTDINKNVGVQFGGGTTTENGAWILMTGGTIKENVAWFGGGAVYSTENGVDWLLGNQDDKRNRQDGWFTMDGGTIEGNTAFTRGGAILADSDGVSLIRGTFKDNMARMLGGAIYVMGDHPDYTYTVYIAKGYVHENKAVSGGYKGTNPQAPADVTIDDDNLKLSQKLVGTDGCEPISKLFNGYMDKNSDDTVDGYPPNQKDSTDGTGGGVWLCSYGNTTLDLSDESEFYINDNTATGSVRHQPISGPGKGGDDLHKDTKNNGSLVITGIDTNDNWVDQNSGDKYTSPKDGTNSVKDTAMRNLINNGTTAGNDMPATYDPANYNGVDFYGNLSRRGGALAADGSFVFGKTQNIAQLFAEMSIKKAWTDDDLKQPIVLKVFVETDEDKIEFAEVRLSEDGTAASELDVVFDEGNYEGRLMLPAFVEKRNEDDEIVDMIQVFDIKVNGSVIDLNSVDDLEALATAIQDNPDSVEFSSEGRKITFEEYIEVDGELVKTDKFQLSPAKISLGELGATIKAVKQKQTDGSDPTVVKASFPELKLNANVTNDKPAEIEKFVNEAVHKNIALDEVFTYDIVAYVKQDADKIVITDTLVDDLEFVSVDTEVKLYDLGTENNHKPTNNASGEQINDDATVSGGTEIENTEIVVDGQPLKKVEIKDQTLTVTLANLLEFDDDGNYQKNADEDQILTPLRGHWVRVSFQAQIKEEYQNKINNGEWSLDDLQNVKIKADDKFKPEDSIYEGEDEYRPTPNVGNKPVDSNEDHDGIINTASYAVEVANKAAYRDESNTVTVKPELPELEKYVNQAVHKDISLDEVFTYDIIGYITHNADKVVFEDTLVDCLELANVENIKVVSLDENNHKPTNDINGQEINEDASVAEDGDNIRNKQGVTVVADEGGSKLTVTLDDEVTPDGRKRETVLDLRGKYVKVTFQAQIKEEIQNKIKSGEMTLEELLANEVFVASVTEDENAPVESEEAHDGIKNDATMNIYVGNDAKYDLTSNVVTVKPEQPEIEKYVNQAVHDYIDLDEVFTYDIIAYITKDADMVEITDELDSQLQFESGQEDIKVVDLGESDNHKVTNDINAKKVNKDASVAEKGTEIEKKTVTIEGNTLTVKLAPENSDDKTVENLRGHWVKVTFDAKIKDGLTADDLTYTQIDANTAEERDGPNVGNDPVLSDESHDGVPNKASYTIGVRNGADIEEKYSDESNTVTVKPEEFEIEISKQDLDGNYVPGANLVVLDSKDKEVVSWTSESKPHKLELKAGEYVLKEESAPSGLKVITTPVKFSIDSKGKVSLKTKKVDNGGKVSVTGKHITLKDAPVDTDLQKFVNYDGKSQKAKSKDDTFEFRIVATVPYGVSKFEITDPIPEPLLYVEDSLQIYIDDDFIDETSAVMATEEPDYIAVSITSDDDGTMDVSEVYGKDVALVFECRIDPKADLSKYKDVVNTAYVFLNDSDKPVKGEDDDVKASVLGINDLTDKDGKSKKKGANTGDNTPIEFAVFGLLASAAAYAIIRRRREN